MTTASLSVDRALLDTCETLDHEYSKDVDGVGRCMCGMVPYAPGGGDIGFALDSHSQLVPMLVGRKYRAVPDTKNRLREGVPCGSWTHDSKGQGNATHFLYDNHLDFNIVCEGCAKYWVAK